MKINWLLIAWWAIPVLGWTSIILLINENSFGWWVLLGTCVWIFICFIWGLVSTKDYENEIYQDALINRKLMERDDERGL